MKSKIVCRLSTLTSIYIFRIISKPHSVCKFLLLRNYCCHIQWRSRKYESVISEKYFYARMTKCIYFIGFCANFIFLVPKIQILQIFKIGQKVEFGKLEARKMNYTQKPIRYFSPCKYISRTSLSTCPPL